MSTVTSTVTSKDGTIIAFERSGTGPTVVLVDGALTYRALDRSEPHLADLLSERFTVVRYDRRGRGDSGDTPPYAVARETEDLEALIDEVGGPAFVVGFSSGASLALAAATALPGKLSKLALYEPPYNDDAAAQQTWRGYTEQLGALLAEGRRGDAVAAFMKLTGAPAEAVAEMRGTPVWPTLEAVAPTLAYDHIALLGESAAVPREGAARVGVPTLVLDGGSSYPFMHETAALLASLIPNAQRRTLEGQSHEVEASALAPVLTAFFGENL